jgi:hypothetical protein
MRGRAVGSSKQSDECEPPAAVVMLARARKVAILHIDVIQKLNERMRTMEEKMMPHKGGITSIILEATFAVVVGTMPVMAKECYAPDARSQERAFSRAVVTEGGKTVWLGGQTGSPNLDFEAQAREIFSELDKSIKAVGGSGLKDISPRMRRCNSGAAAG